MIDLDIYKRSLSQHYVFYNELKTDPNPLYRNLYSNVTSSLGQVQSRVQELERVVAGLRAAAAKELEKERGLLREIFGQNLHVDLQNKDSIQDFIDTLNRCIGLKDVYERNKAIIKGTKAQKSVISFFPTYLRRAFRYYWPKMSEEIVKRAQTNQAVNIAVHAQTVLDLYFDTVMTSALKSMFNAKTETSEIPDTLRGAYSELINSIGQLNNSNSLASQFYKIYHLDELREKLIQEISETQDISKVNPRTYIPSKGDKNFYIRQGYSLEAIESATMKLLVDKINTSSSNIKASTLSTGSTQVKADNILSFNVNLAGLEQSLTERAKGLREENIQIFNELEHRLSKFKDGYIVYVSDKNYILNEGFEKRGGFSAGESFSAESLLSDIFLNINSNINTFVGAMMQLGKGAVGGKNLREDLQKSLAKDIAYFLFDDFDTIGKDLGGGHAIHLMNLNGIYIPLSYFLNLVANAFEAAKKTGSLVTVSIKAPDIIYGNPADRQAARDAKLNPWNEQRTYALSNTMITVHFFRNIKELVREHL